MVNKKRKIPVKVVEIAKANFRPPIGILPFLVHSTSQQPTREPGIASTDMIALLLNIFIEHNSVESFEGNLYVPIGNIDISSRSHAVSSEINRQEGVE